MSANTNQVDWDVYARCYDSLLSLKPYQKLQKEVVLMAKPQSGEFFLDVGCGTGNTTVELCESEAGVMVQALDASVSMLGRARQKCQKYGSRVQFHEHDIARGLNLFPGQSFDGVVCINVLYALSDPEAALVEILRVLKPGGRLVLELPVAGHDNGLILREHCESKRSKDYWRFSKSTPEHQLRLLSEAVSEEGLLQQMQYVAKQNSLITTDRSFYFPSKADLASLLEYCGFEVMQHRFVYAEQGQLVECRKHKGV